MEFIAKKGEVIVMDEDETYLVLATYEYNGSPYLHLIKTGEHILDDNYNVELDKTIYAKEILTEDDNYLLEFVTDEQLIKVLKTL